MKLWKTFGLVTALAFGLQVTSAFAVGPSASAINDVLKSPVSLLVLAILIWLIAGKGEAVVASRASTGTVGLGAWLSQAKPTFGAIGLIVIGWVVLIATGGITDEAPVSLMVYAAAGLGIAPNNVMDILTKGSRQNELVSMAKPKE